MYSRALSGGSFTVPGPLLRKKSPSLPPSCPFHFRNTGSGLRWQLSSSTRTGAPERISHQEWREATAPEAPLSDDATTKEKMRYKLRTTNGRAEYDRRKITVEPCVVS
jgi:hypothetical protein